MYTYALRIYKKIYHLIYLLILFRCFFVVDEDAAEFSLENPFYKSQFDKDLSHNVFKNGQWGSFRNLPLETVKDIGAIHAYNTLEVRGDLSSFRWIEGPLSIDR